MTIKDITRPLGPSTPVWPGDVVVTLERTMSRAAGDLVNNHALHTSVHAGTHIDSPKHLFDDAWSVEQVDLRHCIGEAIVVDVGDAPVIGVEELPHLAGVRRVLFKTCCSRLAVGQWPEGFPALTPEAAAALVEAGVWLVGVDSPSVDAQDSEDLQAHKLLLTGDVMIVENLWLADVEPGPYELIALPLRLTGADASPARAVLRTLDPE
ncbi:MAG: cyclase family protein [bacterium]